MTTDEQFAAFWNAYPKRVARKKAREAFEKAIKRTTLEVMLTALEWQVKQPMWLKDEGAFIIFPQGWLNQERWEDECPPSLRPKVVYKPTLAYCGECQNTGWVGDPVRKCSCRQVRTA